MTAMSHLSSVRFVGVDGTALVARGTSVLEAAAEVGVVIPAPCGGRGACGRCAVTVLTGELEPPSDQEVAALARARVGSSEIRLACMARIAGDVTLRPLGISARVSGVAASQDACGVAVGVDLGTTSVAVQAVETSRRSIVGTARVPNRQAAFGADVLSRVSAALSGAQERLKTAAEDSVIEALELACGGAGASEMSVERVVIAGNTAMVSLLAGVEVVGLASHPFSHSLATVRTLDNRRIAAAVGGAEVLVVPPVAAFVGGDLVAGMVAEGLAGEAGDALFIDLGTNAEVAAVTGGRAVVTSAPAGPAFEGWGIACGGQAGPGGIVSVMPSDSQGGLLPVTEGGPPYHLTGSGLISAVALLRRAGHLDADGLLRAEGPACDRFFTADGVRAVALGEDPADRSVFLSQLDVRSLQSAKAAVCVAVRAVASEVPVEALRDVIVTGAFGGALEVRDLVDLGIVPKETAGTVRQVPDAALRGAACMALDPSLFADAEALVSRASHVDLAMGESFTAGFIAALRLEPYSF
jgi:uncharacterized 2Fe-2S/4Fe-4S cluster protein (DUF4445 family)